jgi:hypothetical protein
LIVGESLFGVLLAAIIVFSNKASSLGSSAPFRTGRESHWRRRVRRCVGDALSDVPIARVVAVTDAAA